MNINRLFSDKIYLERQIDFFLNKEQIRIFKSNKELTKAHLDKAKHNIAFFQLTKEEKEFYDWQIVTLYYALYHCALALISNKNYSSKNHYATILLLIKEYSISQEEAQLIEDLSINKEDAQLYTDLKQDRHDASYTTQLKFSQELIDHYHEAVIKFLNKSEEIIAQ